MKLQALRLRDVGCFSQAVALENFSGELDVLAAPNEAGKSTLFRALSAVFFTKHTSRAAAVKALKSDEGGAPLVEVVFSAEGKSWRLRKRFLSSPDAELEDLSRGRIVARKADADDQALALIGLTSGDHGPFGLLWVPQKASLDPLRPRDHGSAAATLQAAIEAEVGQVTGGARARWVQRQVQTALSELVSPAQRRPQGPYREAIAQRDQLKTQLAEAQSALAAHEKTLEDLAATQKWLAEHASPETLAALRAERDAIAEKLKHADQAQAAWDVAQQKVKTARLHWMEAQKNRETFQARIAEWQRLAQERDSLTESLQTAQKAKAQAQKAKAKAQEKAQNAETRLREAQAERDRHYRQRHRKSLEEQIQERERQLAEVKRLRGEKEKSQAALSANTATEKRRQALVTLTRTIADTEGQLRAASPHLTITYDPHAKTQIFLDDQPLAHGTRLQLSDDTRLRIPGVGEILVETGNRDTLQDLESDLAAQKETLTQLLKRMGAEDVETALALADKRQALKRDMAALEDRMALLPPAETLQAEITERKRELAALEDDPPRTTQDLTEAQAALSQAETTAAQARDSLREAEIAFHRAEFQEKELETARKACETSLAALAQVLPPQERWPEEEAALAEAYRQAAQDLAAAEAEAEKWAALVPSAEDRQALALRLQRLESALENREREIQAHKTKIQVLEDRLAHHQADGLSEKLAEIQGRLAAADARVRAFEERVAVLTLLQQTLADVAETLRETFTRPVVERMAPYLSLVFPGARLTFDRDLAIGDLIRGDRTENFSRLSDGTQEQIAVLTRLAFGKLLAEQGRAVPVILDDALVYSDDARIERLFDALTLAAQSHQVIIFTCRTATFDRLGGTRLRITPSDFSD